MALIPNVEGTPQISDGVTLIERQSTGGLEISPDPSDLLESRWYQITEIENGALFESDWTAINNGDFVSSIEAKRGLRFRPNPGFVGEANFYVQAALRPNLITLGGKRALGKIIVLSTPWAMAFMKCLQARPDASFPCRTTGLPIGPAFKNEAQV